MFWKNPDDDKTKINHYGAKVEKKLHMLHHEAYAAGVELWRYHTEVEGGRYNELSNNKHGSVFKGRMNGTMFELELD